MTKDKIIYEYPTAIAIQSETLGEDRGGGDYDTVPCWIIIVKGEEHFAELGVEKVSTGSWYLLGVGDNEAEAWEDAAKPRDKRWPLFPYISDFDLTFVANKTINKYAREERN